ncbi:Ig-like domain-containing protein [Nocardia cyriacigeorgica]|uniref:Ig-like domain-containing protein n=1 Tax=Nocardia cyriacigeorgica TaxID=135487 RepID=UPI002455537E|nr:Ig-like domain-containing protein [Nocardia cyriacigeorgica]
MAPTTLLALKGKNDALVLSALDWLVALHPWTPGAPYMPEHLTDSNGVLQELSAGWLTSGEIQKQAAVNIAPDTQTSPIEGYGSSGPRRVIPTGEALTVDFTAQEWRKINLSLYHNIDLALTAAEPGRGFTAHKTSQLNIFYYSALLIARDAGPTGDLYPWFKLPKVAVSKRGAMASQIGKEMPMPLTLTIFDDADYIHAATDGEGGLYDFGVAGKGFDAIAAAAGFLSAPASITVHPSTGDLVANELLQLTVVDSNGYDRTAECTWGTSSASTATVSASGLVAGVAAGSATITATLGALTDTCSVTVV